MGVAHEHANSPHSLLRTRHDRPRSRRAAEHGDELPPFLIELHPIPHELAPQGSISNWQGSVSWDDGDYASDPRGGGPLRLNRVGSNGSRRPRHVRFCSGRIRSSASQQIGALCQEWTHALQQTTASLSSSALVSLKAFGFHQYCERVQLKVAHKVVPAKQAQPLLLRLICKLLAFLRTGKLKLSDSLQVMNHFVN